MRLLASRTGQGRHQLEGLTMASHRHRRWRFKTRHLTARGVCVVGDFNEWSPYATAMQSVGSGVWVAHVELLPGTYRYRYLTGDGEWLTDWTAFGVIQNGFGGWDSLVFVPPRPRRTRGWDAHRLPDGTPAVSAGDLAGLIDARGIEFLLPQTPRFSSEHRDCRAWPTPEPPSDERAVLRPPSLIDGGLPDPETQGIRRDR